MERDNDNQHDVLVYRVDQIEEAVKTLAETAVENTRFITELKVWMRIMAWISGLVGAAVVALIIKIILTGMNIG